MKKKYWITTPILGVVFVLGILVGGINLNGTPAAITEDVGWKSEVCWWKNNELVGCNHNLITNEGRDWIKNQTTMNPVTTSKVNAVAVTNETGYVPTATHNIADWEAIEESANGLNRTNGSIATSNKNVGNWWVNFTWTATGTTTNIHTAALATAQSGGVLIAESALSSNVSLESGDTLKTAWNISVS